MGAMALLLALPLVAEAFVDLNSTMLLPADLAPTKVIDHYVDQKLEVLKIVPAPPADPHALCRRITLDLAGRIPTPAEIEAFLGTHTSRRRDQLVARHLASQWYVRHTARELNAMLKGLGGNGPDLTDYLASAVDSNRRWDTMFRELVGVSPAPLRPERFILERLKDRDLLTRDVSAIYFGLNISCAQCHTHPYVDTLTQDYFFGMKSFFARSYDFEGTLLERNYAAQLEYEPVGESARRAPLMFLSGEVVALDPPAATDLKEAIAKEDQQIARLRKRYQEARKKDPQADPPIPADAELNLRERLVQLALSDSNQTRFARSMVNRMWYRFMGYGLVMRVDQMHAGNSASHPELLVWLTRDFIAHKFNLRRLTRAIVGSQAYARSSVWAGAGTPPAEVFAVAPLRPLAPLQMGLSILAAGDGITRDSRPPEPLQARIAKMETAAAALFAEVFEDPYEGLQFNAAEALAMSNDADRLAAMGRRLVDAIFSIEDRDRQVETAVLAVLGRPPVSEEKEWITEYLASRTDRRDALQQVVWALFTSSEFRFNH